MKSRNAIVKITGHVLFVCILFLCADSVALAQAGRGASVAWSPISRGSGFRSPVVLLDHATGTSSTRSPAPQDSTPSSPYPGVYEVTASEKGFKSVAEDNVTVTVDQVSTVNIAPASRRHKRTVTVVETASLVDTSNSTVGQLVDSATIDRVPLLDRNVYDLVQLSAGVTPAQRFAKLERFRDLDSEHLSRAPRSRYLLRHHQPAPSSARSTTCSMAALSASRKTMPPAIIQR